MKNQSIQSLVRPFVSLAFAGALLATAVLPADAGRAPPLASYDGVWSVSIYTVRGDCDRAVRASLRVSGGRVSAEDQTFQASGAVSSGGAIRVTVAGGGKSASGSGRLSGNGGTGHWRTASGQCSGQWTAERRSW
jgi:hypothetical protein